MAKIVSVHSFRGGTGKSNTTANLATLLAMTGRRVGVIDTDIQSPGIHVLFGLNEQTIGYALNDYLWGRCDVEQAAHDVTGALGTPISGKIFLIPSSIKTGEIARVLREGFDPGLLNEGIHQLIKVLKLDVLLIDTHPGLNEETLLSVALSDVLVIILRPDHQDYQGTGVTVQLAHKLDVPQLLPLVNKVPASFNLAEVKAKIQQTYNADVAAVLPHSDEMMALGSAGIFALQFPQHPITASLKQLMQRLID